MQIIIMLDYFCCISNDTQQFVHVGLGTTVYNMFSSSHNHESTVPVGRLLPWLLLEDKIPFNFVLEYLLFYQPVLSTEFKK